MYKAQAYLVTKNLCDAGVYVGSDNPNTDKKSAGNIGKTDVRGDSRGNSQGALGEKMTDWDLYHDGDRQLLSPGSTSRILSSGTSVNSNIGGMDDVNSSSEGTGSMIHELKVSTVDAFQGSEMDIIIICISKNSGSSFLR
jgi:hypothetical protein